MFREDSLIYKVKRFFIDYVFFFIVFYCMFICLFVFFYVFLKIDYCFRYEKKKFSDIKEVLVNCIGKLKL